MISIKINRGKMSASAFLLVNLICASLILASCKPSATTSTPQPIQATNTPFIIVVTSTPIAATNTPETLAPAVTDTVEAKQPTATPGVVPANTPVSVQGTGVLFGPFHLPDAEFAPPFTGAFVSLRPEMAQATLDAARAAGMHLVVSLAGGRRAFQASDGAFALPSFESQLEKHRGIDLSSYVADGTVIGHLMFDEPQDPSNWNGSPVPYLDIDAAAQYSKQLWPTLPVGVGGPPSYIAGGAPYTNLDFAFAQYTTKQADSANWLKKEVSLAQQAGLGLLLSINILGGNNRNPVTAEQLTEWGTSFINEPYACGLLMWKYDPAYLQSSDIMAALETIGQAARQRQARLCMP